MTKKEIKKWKVTLNFYLGTTIFLVILSLGMIGFDIYKVITYFINGEIWAAVLFICITALWIAGLVLHIWNIKANTKNRRQLQRYISLRDEQLKKIEKVE